MVDIRVARERRRSLSIHVTALGEVIVKAPASVPESDIKSFVDSKNKWITQTLSRVNGYNQYLKEVINYRKILLCGDFYNICFFDAKSPRMQDNVLYLPNHLKNDHAKLMRTLHRYFIRLFLTTIENELLECSQLMGLKYHSLKINNNKTRWGSCDNIGVISINFRAGMLDRDLLRYLIIHELAHIVVFDHSHQFWKVVAKFCPDYKRQKAHLKQFSALLLLYRE